MIADRKMAGLTGDQYIDLNLNNDFSELHGLLEDNSIQSINQHLVYKDDAKWIIKIVDYFTNEIYEANIVLFGNSTRFRIQNYANSTKLYAGEVVFLIMEINGTDCDLRIGTECLYKYTFKKYGNNLFILLSEGKHFSETINQEIEDYFITRNIIPTPNFVEIGKPIKGIRRRHKLYQIDFGNTDFIGLPYDRDLNIDCFDDIEQEIV